MQNVKYNWDINLLSILISHRALVFSLSQKLIASRRLKVKWNTIAYRLVLFKCCFLSIVKKRKVCVRMRTKTCQEREDERMIQQVGIHKYHKKIPLFNLIIITSVSYNFNTKYGELKLACWSQTRTEQI